MFPERLTVPKSFALCEAFGGTMAFTRTKEEYEEVTEVIDHIEEGHLSHTAVHHEI